MALTKMPPIEKIHEACSAIADGRVVIEGNSAKVFSSDHTKTYTVQWEDEVYSSNDSASYWQGYPGYPIIAVLMIQGRLSFHATMAEHFKGINWKKLNAKHKADYAAAVSVILEELQQKGIDCTLIQDKIEKVYGELKELDIKTKRSSTRPPQPLEAARQSE
ncbi:hypothetical protein [Cohnella silvisoli]|uniref:Uncharacterized protein n=1 Tax=Cohnella silvisoli TaxID=2873699 RepID=A0ABV1KPA6_9BACL|nr:hypothetical protein [Cohnella silvisoli]MCD9025570.1 hypothetical protein [Cohnella silvisoli]